MYQICKVAYSVLFLKLYIKACEENVTTANISAVSKLSQTNIVLEDYALPKSTIFISENTLSK
jgi:hypothetical protein